MLAAPSATSSYQPDLQLGQEPHLSTTVIVIVVVIFGWNIELPRLVRCLILNALVTPADHECECHPPHTTTYTEYISEVLIATDSFPSAMMYRSRFGE